MADITDIFGGPYVIPLPSFVITSPPEDQLKEEIIKAGINPPSAILLDGNIHRFNSDEKGNARNGWYIGYRDGIPSAAYGCWKRGIDSTWKGDIGRPLTTEENAVFASRLQELKALRQEEARRQYQLAADSAAHIWSEAQMAPANHPYLVRKGIRPNGVRATGDNRLIVPVTNPDTSISSLQYISENGQKQFHPGGATSGKYWIMGAMDEGGPIYIAEGFATAATIREETNRPVVVAFSAQNIPKVATIIRQMNASQIVICADNDESGTGLKFANEASSIIGATVIMPPSTGDMNDFKQAGHDLGELLRPRSGKELREALKAVYINEIPNTFIPSDDLIQNIVARHTFSMLYGDSNSGKTFLAIDMACHIALGRDWMGSKVEQGMVVYLASESPQSVINRIIAFQQHHAVEVPNFLVVQVPINFHANDSDAVRIIEMIRHEEGQRGTKCELIVGDTLARMASGANENSGEDMGPVMDRFDLLMNSIEATVLLIHHSGKDQSRGSRGWSGLRAHIDTEIEVSEKDEIRKASITKQRALPSKGMDIYFKLDIVELGIGKWDTPATTCIVKKEITPVADYSDKKNDAHRIFADAWYCKGKELNNGLPYITRSALFTYLNETFAWSDSTIEKKLKPSGDIMSKIQGQVTKIDHGWVISDPAWAAQCLMA
jgi:putative DNA primase/helicase